MFTGRHLSMDIMANVDVSQHATPILILQVTCRVFCIFIQIPERMTNYYYRPQRSCGQGYVFTRVCDSVHRGRGSPGTTPPPGTRQTPPQDQADPPRPGRHPRTRQTLPDQADTPPDQADHPPDQADSPPDQTDPPPRTRQTPPPPPPTPPGRRLQHTVNERPVRILLECILV